MIEKKTSNSPGTHFEYTTISFSVVNFGRKSDSVCTRSWANWFMKGFLYCLSYDMILVKAMTMIYLGFKTIYHLLGFLSQYLSGNCYFEWGYFLSRILKAPFALTFDDFFSSLVLRFNCSFWSKTLKHDEIPRIKLINAACICYYWKLNSS